MRLTRCVVPDRGIPTTINGSSIGIDSISGYRLISSISDSRLRNRRTIRWRSDERVSWVRPSSDSIAATCAANRLAEAIGVAQIVAHCSSLGGLGEHPIAVQFDGPGLGELQNLTLDLGQPRRCQIVEVDVNCAAPPSRHCRMQSSASHAAFSRNLPGYAEPQPVTARVREQRGYRMSEMIIASPDDVIAFLKAQHNLIEDMFDQVLHASDPQAREKPFVQLRQLLAVHETAEEMVVHPRARREVENFDSIVDARLEEEHDAKQLLSDDREARCHLGGIHRGSDEAARCGAGPCPSRRDVRIPEVARRNSTTTSPSGWQPRLRRQKPSRQPARMPAWNRRS